MSSIAPVKGLPINSLWADVARVDNPVVMKLCSFGFREFIICVSRLSMFLLFLLFLCVAPLAMLLSSQVFAIVSSRLFLVSCDVIRWLLTLLRFMVVSW